MTHRQKQRLARKKMTKEEILNRVSMFQSDFWLERGMQIRERVKQTEQNRENKKSIKK